MPAPRSSGVLCHITSLPGRFPVGDLGPAATEMVDWLVSAGQSIWQILPLGPPAQANSPYSAYSAFAGNPLLISPERLVEEGWIEGSDLPSEPALPNAHVDFEAAAAQKERLLQLAFDRWTDRGRTQDGDAYAEFETTHAWLHDFATFEAIMLDRGQAAWTRWPIPLVLRESHALASERERLAHEIAYSKFKQFLFDEQWFSLKQYANERGVRLYGDMPIFVAHESADVWADQSLFALDAHGNAKLVAGVPPDYFSKTGQRWGNPQYRWDRMAETGYQWWVDRFERALQQYDLLRVDHFRGFEAYWEIPGKAPTAVDGRWRDGPGAAPFEAAAAKLGPLPLIAEDLGLITDGVHRLRDHLGFPGMRVLQFGFDDPNDDFHRPNAYTEHSVAYTGTHDNDTTMGWYHGRNRRISDDDLLSPIVTSEVDIHWQLISAVMGSRSSMTVVPIQDCLGLGNDARMNVPGKAIGNWSWRLQPGQLTAEVAGRLKAVTFETDRICQPAAV
ncbi:MAG: 4-alpha-glucanotransferase [Planctomycetota bacterium]